MPYIFQDKEKIYYLTIRDIDVGEELKVWYAPFYSKKMDKPLLLTSVTEDDEEIPLEEALGKYLTLKFLRKDIVGV